MKSSKVVIIIALIKIQEIVDSLYFIARYMAKFGNHYFGPWWLLKVFPHPPY